MAATLSRVNHPLGGRIFANKGGMVTIRYKITGDGNATPLNLDFDRLSTLVSHTADESLSPVIDTNNRRVTVTVPATLGAGEEVFVDLIGKGGV